MSLTILFRREARIEFDFAADWYERRRLGRGAMFTAAVRATLNQIADQPDIHARVFEDVRQALVKRYPYSVLYRTEPGILIVVAVFHSVAIRQSGNLVFREGYDAI